MLCILANEAEGNDEQGFTRSLGDAAAQEAAHTGSRIVDRELNLRPTLGVSAGAPVRVLVTDDILLAPYTEQPMPVRKPTNTSQFDLFAVPPPELTRPTPMAAPPKPAEDRPMAPARCNRQPATAQQPPVTDEWWTTRMT